MSGLGWIFVIFVIFIILIIIIGVIVSTVDKGKVPLGDPCLNTSDCSTNLVCQSGFCRSTSGGNCDRLSDCASGQSPPLISCSAPSGSNQRVCSSTAPQNGQSCESSVSNGSCASGLICTSGTCRGGAGSTCSSTLTCGTQYSCTTTGTTSTCTGNAGASCSTSAPCSTGFACTNGVCVTSSATAVTTGNGTAFLAARPGTNSLMTATPPFTASSMGNDEIITQTYTLPGRSRRRQ
jgi:hypothetical protein